MSTVAELLVKIGADSSGLRKELASTQRQMKRAFGPEALESSNAAGGIMVGLVATMGAVGLASVKMSADMEQNRIAFTTMLGSAQKADDFLRELASFAERTPFEFPGLVNSSKKMLAFGFEAKQIIPIMTNIGDAVAALGGSAEVLDRVTLAFGQMKAKGFISGEEMRQLAEAGIPAWEMLSKVIGTDIPTAMKMAEDKAINAETTMAGMFAQMGERYGGMMDKQSTTITGMFSNIKDKAGSIMRDMGDDITEALDLKEKMKSSLEWLNEFASKVKTSGVTEALAEIIPAGMQFTIIGIAGAIMGALVPALIALKVTAMAALVPLLPLMGMGAAIAITAAGIYKLGNAYASTQQPAEDMSQVLSDFPHSVAKAVNEGVGGMSRIGDQAAYTMEEITTATKKVGTTTAVVTGNAAKEWEKLETAATRVSESIEREWVQTTKTQLQQLDIWQDDQLKELEKTRAANENYERDKERVAATYSTRRTKILQQEAQDAVDTFKSIRDGYENIQRSMSGLTGSTKGVADININYDDKAKAAKDYFDKITQDYQNATDAQKKTILSSLDSQNAAYKITEDGKLDLSKATADAITAYGIQKDRELTNYHATAKDIQADIDNAYNANSMAMLQATLTEQNAIRMNDYTAQKSMMETYQEAFLAAHSTTAQLTAELYDGAFSGLSNSLSDIFTMTESVGDAFKALGQSLWQIIADHYAQQIAGMIMVGLFGEQEDAKKIAGATATAAATTASYTAATAAATAHFAARTAAATASQTAVNAMMAASLATTTAMSIAAAAVTAAAWAPAAAMVSLASFGANSVPAMAGIAATTAFSYALAVPALADGGITTGPTMAMIGEGRYQEAVLPLNKRMFEKMGLIGGNGQTIGVTNNNYGDIYHQVDYDELMEDMGNAVQYALMEV